MASSGGLHSCEVTIGVPIYLVSACTSGEEFVAAFRRYADRNGLFVPIAEPIAAGHRARFALTLRNGGVMVEGQGEVVSSARTPSVLHGRVGMTIRFADLDDQSKTVLLELEKARLAMKPLPPSVPPRPANVPPEPRPVPPSPAGRIDANNALAECVAIGIEKLDPVDVKDKSAAKAGPRFVVPVIPPVAAGQRPRTPSTPPLGIDRKVPAKPVVPVVSAAPTAPPGAAAPPGALSTTMTAVAPVTESTIPSGALSDTMPSANAQTTTGSLSPGAFSETMPAVRIADLKPPPDTEPPLFSRTTTRPMEPVLTPVRNASGTDPMPQDAPATRQMPVPRSPAPAKLMAAVEPPPNTTPTEMSAVPPPPSTSLGMAVVSADEPAAVITSLPLRDDPPTSSTTPATTTPAAGMPRVQRATPAAGLPPPLPLGASPPRNATPANAVPVARPPAPTPASPTAGVAPAPAQVPAAPIVADAKAAVPVEIDEPTDLTEMPVPQAPDELVQRSERVPRKTVLGIAVSPSGAQVLPAIANGIPTIEDTRDTSVMSSQSRPVSAAPAVVDPLAQTLRPEVPTPPTPPTPPPPTPTPPTIEEPTPSGDWTMTPGVDGPPTIERRTPVPKSATPKLPTGDWLISIDSAAPDGWSEPSAVDKVVKKTPGPPQRAVSNAEPLESIARPEPTPVAEPKVQIDPTLIEPLTPMPIDEPQPEPASAITPRSMPVAAGASSGGMLVATVGAEQLSEVAMMPPLSQSARMFTPLPGTLPSASGSSQSHRMFDEASGSGSTKVVVESDAESQQMDSTSVLQVGRRRRTIVIVASALLAAAIGVVLFLMFSSSKPASDSPAGSNPIVKGSDAVKVDPTGSNGSNGSNGSGGSDGSAGSMASTTVVDAAVAIVAPPPDAEVAAVQCFVDVASVPTGAEIVIDKATVLGTTPTKLELPCKLEVKLLIRKARYTAVQRAVTPTSQVAKVRVTLTKPMFSVKVSSQPTGATITMNGKSMGVTPTTVKLPAFEPSTLSITKEGYGPDMQKITPKQNNQAVRSTLKKLVRHR